LPALPGEDPTTSIPLPIQAGSATLASSEATPAHRRAALALLVVAGLACLATLPFAAGMAPPIPGFLLMHQTALIIALLASAGVLFAQFRRGRSLPLLLAAGGTLYTACIVTLQMLSYPNVFGPTPAIGAGSATTVWLWTFWHLGPPLCGLAYALALPRPGRPPRLLGPDRVGPAAILAALAAVLAAAASALVATALLPWLPEQVTAAGDYTRMVTSGIGPGVQALTLLALGAMWWTTRRGTQGRTVLELWLMVSLALLALDNLATLLGAARGTWGWLVGRVLALASGFSVLWAYLAEVDALHARVEAAAAERACAEGALRQAQKMESLGRLTGGVAHDFNNLLMVVTSGFDMIRRRPDDHARVVKLAEAGLQAAERGARLTRQLLTFARVKDLRPETVNPNALVLSSEALIRRALGEAVRLEISLDPALHPVHIDAAELEAAMLNLVVNARDALPPAGGCIRIGSRNARLEAVMAAAMRTSGAASGDYVVLSVTDDGCGMDEATLARVFEPFFTTKDVGKGSGLGLSQVYGFANAAGGVAEIRSAPGEGTTVELWLPRAGAARTSEAGLSSAQGATGVSPMRRARVGETVLAVEDEPGVLVAVVENLADLGYRVLPARDAAEALERLRGAERIDILFSDVVMPGGMNGVQLAAEAARMRPGLKILLTSGYAGHVLEGAHGLPAGLPILAKPYRRDDLARQLRLAQQHVAY